MKVTKVTETWECCTFELWMIRGTRPKLPSLDAAVSPRQGDDGYIIDHRYHISQIPFPRCWRFFRKIPAYVQNFPCPFTSRSRLFALTTDLPGPADGPLNIVQGNILASWSQNQNPFRMSEGDESDGNLGVLLIRTLDDTRYSSKIAISWCSCLATSSWWWIHNRSSISYLTKCPFPGVEDSSERSRPMFKISMPFHLPIQIVCTDHWSARTCWWTPEHCTRQISLHPDPRIKTLSGWVKVTKVTESLGVLPIRTLDDTRYSSRIAISWCSCLAMSRWWWIHHRSSISGLTNSPFPGFEDSCKSMPGLFSKCFMPFHLAIQIASHWPLICQDLLMDPWTLYKAISLHPDPRIKTLGRMSEGDESDGNLRVLHIRALDDTRYSSRIAISWCSCLATSRWWWIHNRSSIWYLTNTLCQLLKTLLKNAWPMFKFCMPFHLAIQIVCTDHWSAEMEKRRPHFSSATPYDRHQFGTGSMEITADWMACWMDPARLLNGSISPFHQWCPSISGFFAKQRHSHGKKVNTTSTVSYCICSTGKGLIATVCGWKDVLEVSGHTAPHWQGMTSLADSPSQHQLLLPENEPTSAPTTL